MKKKMTGLIAICLLLVMSISSVVYGKEREEETGTVAAPYALGNTVIISVFVDKYPTYAVGTATFFEISTGTADMILQIKNANGTWRNLSTYPRVFTRATSREVVINRKNGYLTGETLRWKYQVTATGTKTGRTETLWEYTPTFTYNE